MGEYTAYEYSVPYSHVDIEPDGSSLSYSCPLCGEGLEVCLYPPSQQPEDYRRSRMIGTAITCLLTPIFGLGAYWLIREGAWVAAIILPLPLFAVSLWGIVYNVLELRDHYVVVVRDRLGMRTDSHKCESDDIPELSQLSWPPGPSARPWQVGDY
jgi:hypothetical protein